MTDTNLRHVLVVTGASGTGKTTATRALASRRPKLVVYHFDSIGVPDAAVMEEDFGGPAGWQASATHRWFTRINSELAGGTSAILDGQMRPAFVRDAAEGARNLSVSIVVFCCERQTREQRLVARGVPWLANPQMEEWARYLQAQALSLRLPLVDTTSLSVEEADRSLERILDESAGVTV